MSITAETIRDVCKQLGSQQRLAVRLGVRQATVSRWATKGPPKRGTAVPLLERVFAELEAERAA